MDVRPAGAMASFGRVLVARAGQAVEVVGVRQEEARRWGLREAVVRRMVRHRLRSGATRFVAWLEWEADHPGEARLLEGLGTLLGLPPLTGFVLSLPAAWATPGIVQGLAAWRPSRETWLEVRTDPDGLDAAAAVVLGARRLALPVILAFPLPGGAAGAARAAARAAALARYRPWGVRIWPRQWPRGAAPPEDASPTLDDFLAAAAAFVAALPPEVVVRLVGRRLARERFGGPPWLARTAGLRRRLQGELRRRGWAQGSALNSPTPSRPPAGSSSGDPCAPDPAPSPPRAPRG